MATPRQRGRTLLTLAATVALAACADEPLPDLSSTPRGAPEAPAAGADTAVQAAGEAELAQASPRELARRFRSSIDRAVEAGDPRAAMEEIRRMEQYLSELADDEAQRFVSTWESPSFQEWLASTMRTLQGLRPRGGRRPGPPDLR